MHRNILFLCTGNLCRSPIAEGILKQRLTEKKMDSFTVSSAGTFALDGRPAAELAVEVAAERGVDLSHHHSRHLTREMLERADFVVGMERDHLMEANAILTNAEGKYFLLSDFGPSDLHGQDIEDPYGAPVECFMSTYEEIEKCVEGMVENLLR